MSSVSTRVSIFLCIVCYGMVVVAQYTNGMHLFLSAVQIYAKLSVKFLRL